MIPAPFYVKKIFLIFFKFRGKVFLLPTDIVSVNNL